MKVRDWVQFLRNDSTIEKIGLEMDKGLMCPNSGYALKNEFDSLYSSYLDEEVIQVYYQNGPHNTLLIYENPEKRG